MAENVLHDRPLTGGDEQHGRTATTGLAPMSRVRMLIGYANPAEMDATTTAFCVAGVSQEAGMARSNWSGLQPWARIRRTARSGLRSAHVA
jgi:hypothetical protein